MSEPAPWYLHASPLGAAYQHYANVARGESVLDRKTKELIRVSVASTLRCPHCTEHHLRDALAAGATKEEIAEAILLSSQQAAGTQLNWAEELFEKYLR